MDPLPSEGCDSLNQLAVSVSRSAQAAKGFTLSPAVGVLNATEVIRAIGRAQTVHPWQRHPCRWWAGAHCGVRARNCVVLGAKSARIIRRTRR